MGILRNHLHKYRQKITSIIIQIQFCLIQIEMEEKLAKMVSLLLVVWVLAWTPYAAISCWIIFFDAKNLSPIMGLIPTLCCKVSAGTNAMIYGLR